MKRSFYAILLIWVTAIRHAPATPVDFQFSGTITFGRDDDNWFQGAFMTGSSFTGYIHYDSSLTTRQTNSIDPGFAYYVFNLIPGDPVYLSVTGAGEHTFQSLSPF